MIKIKTITKSKFFKGITPEYYKNLHAPLDGIWESTYISAAKHLQINFGRKIAGYAGVDGNRCLLLFHIHRAFWPESVVIFKHLLGLQVFDNAIVNTGDPLMLSLCLEHQTHLSSVTYLYEDHHPVNLPLKGFRQPVFRPADSSEIERIEAFFQRSLDTRLNFYDIARRLVENQQLFFLLDGDMLIATGELRISKTQPQYADLGIIVAPEYRNRGVGRYVLARLKQMSYERKLKPVCSTETNNYASQKAIIHAGFISRYRLLAVAF